jgi:hypothetical protein
MSVISKIPVCARIGLIAGFFAALLCSGYGEQPFLSTSGTPLPVTTVAGLVPSLMGGLVAALVFAVVAALMHVVLFRYPAAPVVWIGIITAIPVGLAAGFLADNIGPSWLAALAGGLAGFIIGWLVCWILCRKGRFLGMAEPGHG